MIRIYLDLCALKRPFDDQAHPRIWLETQSVSVILQSIESHAVEMVVSPVLFYENSLNPVVVRKDAITRWLSFATFTQAINDSIIQRAETLAGMGISTIDAFHLSCAEESRAEFFITCDDTILKRYRGPLRVSLPTEYVLHHLDEEEDDTADSE